MQSEQSIEQSLHALRAHQQKILRELQSRVTNQLLQRHNENDNFEIITALAPRNRVADMIQCGFFEITLDEECIVSPTRVETDLNAPLFVRGTYADFNAVCSKIFKGHGFDYNFVPLHSFINRAEEKLFSLAQIYDINRPLIFSPYARRAVCIHIKNISSVKNVTLESLRIEQNGLRDVFLTDRTLMWNVKLDPLRDVLVDNVVDTKFHSYFYDNVADNQFILPRAAINQSETQIEQFIRSADGDLELVCNRKFDDEAYRKITVTKPAVDDVPNDVEIFTNACDVPRLFRKNHIRTAADINYILTAISQKDFSARFEPQSKKAPLPKYNNYHAYHSHADEAFNQAVRRQHAPIIDVVFDGREPFVADFANYALQWLGANFPEYRWNGVR